MAVSRPGRPRGSSRGPPGSTGPAGRHSEHWATPDPAQKADIPNDNRGRAFHNIPQITTVTQFSNPPAPKAAGTPGWQDGRSAQHGREMATGTDRTAGGRPAERPGRQQGPGLLGPVNKPILGRFETHGWNLATLRRVAHGGGELSQTLITRPEPVGRRGPEGSSPDRHRALHSRRVRMPQDAVQPRQEGQVD